MEAFSISNIYIDGKGRKTIDINPLPEKYCSFDCVFCPLGRTEFKTDESYYFPKTKDFMIKLENILREGKIDFVFINPWGEALANSELIDIIKVIKSYGAGVRLLSNGYIFSYPKYWDVLNLCDEVIGETTALTEQDFVKFQRPMKGFTLEDYIENMERFNKQFGGKFILDITILGLYSKNEGAIDKLKEIINRIKPEEYFLETPGGKYKAMGLSPHELDSIREKLIIGG
ncbi:MAG: radical SAM protein [Bacillota bacterium]|nr:radical SAM protein [Bacillota bacterium]